MVGLAKKKKKNAPESHKHDPEVWNVEAENALNVDPVSLQHLMIYLQYILPYLTDKLYRADSV